MTKAAWERLNECDVYLSKTLLDELGSTSQPLRDKMLAVVSDFTVLPDTDTSKKLAGVYN